MQTAARSLDLASYTDSRESFNIADLFQERFISSSLFPPFSDHSNIEAQFSFAVVRERKQRWMNH